MAIPTKNPMRGKAAVHSDPDILGGTPVFVGTRVPFQTLMDYLEVGHPLADFLNDFPTVTREKALAALDQAGQALLANARLAG
ncbi:MAG TPA: DUF433 domain-containing protein [Terriglobales bacterium]|nr:DUF433 domain-containing protein [Terriglobales bacterium]